MTQINDLTESEKAHLKELLFEENVSILNVELLKDGDRQAIAIIQLPDKRVKYVLR